MNRHAQAAVDKDVVETARASLESLTEINAQAGAEATCFVGILARGPRPSARTIRTLEMDAALITLNAVPA